MIREATAMTGDSPDTALVAQASFAELMAKIPKAFEDVSQAEIDHLVDEAMGYVRPGFRPSPNR